MPVEGHDISELADRVIAGLSADSLRQHTGRDFFPVFNLATASARDGNGCLVLEQLAAELAAVPAVAARFAEMEREGMHAQVVIYDEMAHHFLSVRVHVR